MNQPSLPDPAPRHLLYPEIEPSRFGHLRVSPVHELYWEEAGNPAGQPVLFLHGGPGAGTNPKHRRYFDPSFYRILLFDQRGAGRSLPHAEIAGNDTPSLVGDIERLRVFLGVSRWLVFGGSWGSTLALAYAAAHRDRVVGLILRGVFLGRQAELNWLYREGASEVFPDAWEGFAGHIPLSERANLVVAYYRRLSGPPSPERLAAARAWATWEGSLLKLLPDPEALAEFTVAPSPQDPAHQPTALARLECHYMVNGLFLPADGYLLAKAPELAALPCRIVHGRYDMVCPLRSAWDLHRAWAGSELRVVPDAGHSASEPGMIHELVQATRDFKTLF